ncbi:MAG TPA: thiamine-phosphate kinase [Acidisoma sp.]|uniref:thiamine-phosphate kinase n=1 Tax=Acidisoma sp. TaxID=1872115 RepID=UPI002CB54C3B|nr:thiamine-phosphate kinase [Acidisoma sp.]HTI00118.1 thiamine-phosphate kinase [Acidisoma sp.]
MAAVPITADVGGLPPEFGLIGRHFRPLAGPAALDLEDDAAVLAPPPGRELVMAADTMVSGVHYLPDDPAEGVGQKLLRVNLSDLAAMAAEPLGYLLAVSAPADTPDTWFAGFAAGLAADQAEFGLSLLGGDTTSTPGPITLSLTIIGHVAPGQAVRRRGARPGDEVWVTGTIGDGALGLAVSLGKLADPSGFLRGRYCVPSPRLGLPLAGRVSAAIDVSDGLLQDLGHLCRLSGCGAEVEAASVPMSEAARVAGPGWLAQRLGGGDDYELLLAVPEGRGAALAEACAARGVPLTRIGRFVAGPGAVRVLGEDGQPLAIGRHGWSHF